MTLTLLVDMGYNAKEVSVAIDKLGEFAMLVFYYYVNKQTNNSCIVGINLPVEFLIETS